MCAAMTFRAFSGLARFDGADDVLVADPSDAIYSWGSFPLQRVKAIPKQPDRQMVEQCGELHLLPFPCCFAHTRQPLGHASLALCRVSEGPGKR